MGSQWLGTPLPVGQQSLLDSVTCLSPQKASDNQPLHFGGSLPALRATPTTITPDSQPGLSSAQVQQAHGALGRGCPPPPPAPLTTAGDGSGCEQAGTCSLIDPVIDHHQFFPWLLHADPTNGGCAPSGAVSMAWSPNAPLGRVVGRLSVLRRSVVEVGAGQYRAFVGGGLFRRASGAGMPSPKHYRALRGPWRVFLSLPGPKHFGQLHQRLQVHTSTGLTTARTDSDSAQTTEFNAPMCEMYVTSPPPPLPKTQK